MDNRHDTVKLALYERFLKDASALPPMPDTKRPGPSSKTRGASWGSAFPMSSI